MMISRKLCLAGTASLAMAGRPASPRPIPADPKPHFPVSGINRHTGKPHEHRREIARRLRQAAKATPVRAGRDEREANDG